MANIESLLQAITNRPTAQAAPYTSNTTPLDEVDHGDISSHDCVPGDVGLHAESGAARDTVTQTASQDSVVYQDQKYSRALDSLRRIVFRTQQDV